MTDYQSHQQQQQSQLLHPASQSHLTVGGSAVQSSEISIDGIKTPTTPTVPLIQQQASSLTNSISPSHSHSRPSTSDAAPSRSTRERDPSSGAGGSGGGSGGSSGTDSSNPYRSFRVTLEDPCYKVLPAALKKYKINDDWRLYALFICYGNTGGPSFSSLSENMICD